MPNFAESGHAWAASDVRQSAAATAIDSQGSDNHSDLELSLEGYQDAHERAHAIVKLEISHLATGDADHQSHTGVRAQCPCLPGESDRPQDFRECV
jgi:hypothetical protein